MLICIFFASAQVQIAAGAIKKATTVLPDRHHRKHACILHAVAEVPETATLVRQGTLLAGTRKTEMHATILIGKTAGTIGDWHAQAGPASVAIVQWIVQGPPKT